MHVDGGISQRFTITDPDQHADTCTVVMPAVVVEKVREHVGASDVLRTDRFWQALCEEVVANYVWQHGDFPPDGRLSLDDLSSGLLRWVDVVTDRTG